MICDGRLDFTEEDFWPHDHMEKLEEEDLVFLVRLEWEADDKTSDEEDGPNL